LHPIFSSGAAAESTNAHRFFKINALIPEANLISINALGRRSADVDKSWIGMTIFGNKRLCIGSLPS
jgi:hypothetical protein